MTTYNPAAAPYSPSTASVDSDNSMSGRHRQFFREEFLASYEYQVNHLTQQFVGSLGHLRGESVTHANILNNKIDVSVNEALLTVGNEIQSTRSDVDQRILRVINDNHDLAVTFKDQIQRDNKNLLTLITNSQNKMRLMRSPPIP